jgi:hypothetical protein
MCVCFEFCVCGALEEEDRSSMKGRRETKRHKTRKQLEKEKDEEE